VLVGEPPHAGPPLRRHGLPGQLVDPVDHPLVVGHQVVEADVDRPAEHVTVGHALAEHPLDAIGPVPAGGHRVGRGLGHPGAVGHHGAHRGGDRHRVAVGHHERGVGERLQQHRELLEVLW
jgi:hypothetical protein